MNLAVCKVAIAPLRADKSDASEMVSQILFGELIKIKETSNNWIFVETQLDNYRGWVDNKQFEFINENEFNNWFSNQQIITKNVKIKTNIGTIELTKGAFLHKKNLSEYTIGNLSIKSNYVCTKPSLISFAKSFINSPYLWGGKTNFGIDCSGFTQTIFRNSGIEIPRDASEQEKKGEIIPFEKIKSGDLAFFTNPSGKIIHVGLLISKKEIIHASGRVKIDAFDQKGIYSNDLNQYSHTLHSIKRML